METSAFTAWHNLHVRVARGEKLTADEQAVYESGIRELDSEEQLKGDLGRLRQLRANVARLEAENKRLRTERQELDAKIATVEARLSAETRQELGTGVS